MIIDVTGIELTPGNGGAGCLGNGNHFDKNGKRIECLCDECDYMMCCFMMNDFGKCSLCDDTLSSQFIKNYCIPFFALFLNMCKKCYNSYKTVQEAVDHYELNN